MKVVEAVAVLWVAIAFVWIVGNAIITYSTGVHYSGEADYDHYHSSKARP